MVRDAHRQDFTPLKKATTVSSMNVAQFTDDNFTRFEAESRSQLDPFVSQPCETFAKQNVKLTTWPHLV